MVAQLYVTPTSCGAASYIAASKAGLIGNKVEASLVNLSTHKIETGAKKGEDFYAVNPKGNVPTIVLEDGTVLNENAAVLQYVADINPSAGLAPTGNARYVLQSKLSYISSEVHANVGPLFNPALEPAVKDVFIARIKSKLDYLSNNDLAGGKQYLVGDTFTVADSYLYIVLSWLGYLGLNLGDWPVLKSWWDGIAALDFVKAAHAGLAELEKQK